MTKHCLDGRSRRPCIAILLTIVILTMSSTVYYLDCPFEEKDDAKSIGARWDKDARKWFVPSEFYPMLEQFNRWKPNGKVYLDAPYEDRENVKKAGANWDPIVKKWYVSTKAGKVAKKYSKWLTVDPSDSVEEGLSCQASSPNSKPKAAARRRGNAADATLLRINENMTVAQLQEECKYRGIKGLSGKNKDWLLEQLEVGSIWQVNRQQQVTGAIDVKPTSSSTEMSDSDTKKTKSKSTKSNTEKRPVKASKTTDENSPKKAKVVKAKAASIIEEKPASIDFSALPRVTPSLTVAQLSHEIMFRDPTIKGISSKPKPWLLSQLGENSIWTTSPEISIDLSKAPRVSKSMTVAQLVHELLTRTPTMTGLSSKKKEELLSVAGVGSIWMTGEHVSTDGVMAKKPAAAKAGKPNPKPKDDTDVKKSKPTADKESTVKKATNSKSKPSPFSDTPTVTKSILKTATKTEKAKPAVVKSKSTPLVATMCARKHGYDHKKTNVKVKEEEPSANRIKAEPVSSAEAKKKVRIPVVTVNMNSNEQKFGNESRDSNEKGFLSKGKELEINRFVAGMDLHFYGEYKAHIQRFRTICMCSSRCAMFISLQTLAS